MCARRQALYALAEGGAFCPPAPIGDEAVEQHSGNLLMAGTRHDGVSNAQFNHPSGMASRRGAGGFWKPPGFDEPRQPSQCCERPTQFRDPVEREAKRGGATDQRTLDDVDPNGSSAVAQQQMFDLLLVDGEGHEMRQGPQIDPVGCAGKGIDHAGADHIGIGRRAPDRSCPWRPQRRILEPLQPKSTRIRTIGRLSVQLSIPCLTIARRPSQPLPAKCTAIRTQ